MKKSKKHDAKKFAGLVRVSADFEGIFWRVFFFLWVIPTFAN
jgi:hypothetical protein